MLQDKPKTIREAVEFYRTSRLDPIKIIRALLRDKFGEAEIKREFSVTPADKPLLNGGSNALIGLFYIAAAIIGIYTLGAVFGSFRYAIRGEGDMIRANMLVIRPFLILAAMTVGIGLVANRGTFSPKAKTVLLVTTILSLLLTFMSSNPISLAFPASLLILLLAFKPVNGNGKTDTEIIINGINNQNTDAEIARKINAKPRRGTDFALVLLLCAVLFINSPFRISSASTFQNMTGLDYYIAAVFKNIIYALLPLALFLYFRKNLIVIRITVGIIVILAILLLRHEKEQTALIPCLLLILTGVAAMIKNKTDKSVAASAI